MSTIKLIGFTFFAFLAVGGLVTASGPTGNVVSSSPAFATGWVGYTLSIIGLAGFFTMLALNKKDEEMY